MNTTLARRAGLLLLLATGWLVSGCSEGELSYACREDDCGASDAGPADTASGDGIVAFDVDEESEGGRDGTSADGAGDLPSDVEPGAFGWPCQSNADCTSGFCIVGLDGNYICTVRCSDTCDEPGYACQLIEASGADLVRICYPQIYDLCKPCEEDFECGGLADRCVELEDGFFCGSDCQLDGACPESYQCRDVDGSRQCVPTNGFCSGCFDRDSDGYGIGSECLGTDCQDLDPFVFNGAPELCDFKDNDCDNLVDEDFDVTTDVDHCGGCNQPCELPNAVNICVSSTCFIEYCEPGFYDLDREAPGCEYECVDEDLTIEDFPDPDFADTNCDGIDGDIEQSVFVSPFGHPDGDGSLEDPVDTIWRGIELAAESAGATPVVLVAEGTYTGQELEPGEFDSVRMVNGVHLFGGYDADDWRRTEDNLTAISGSRIGVIAEDIADDTYLGGITIQAEAGGTATSGSGENSIAVLADNASGLIVVNSVLEAGQGGSGENGGPGSEGDNGGVGGVGGTGFVWSTVACADDPDTAPARGNPGSSTCHPGGWGGYAGWSDGSETHPTGRGGDGATGGAASDGRGNILGGAGGKPGENEWGFCICPGGCVPDCPSSDPDCADGEDGDPGCTGLGTPAGCASRPAVMDGFNGDGGDGVGAADSDGMWRGDPGESGGDGDDGYGGGGGGGGGGATGDCSGWTGCCDGWGGSGGGGGGAGCGGGGGTGGMAGGGSFGLYVIDSAPSVIGGSITARNGGRGGNGGDGGMGGSGGSGGNGGTSNCNGGIGGDGGDGIGGGDGGDGGGGGGGVSYAIFLVDASDENIADVDTSWGLGGAGGGGNSPGTRGQSGPVGTASR